MAVRVIYRINIWGQQTVHIALFFIAASLTGIATTRR